MLTHQKIEIYRRCRGDIDYWARSTRSAGKTNMQDSDWYLISELISDLTLVKNGLAAESYAANVSDRLKENCDSQETINELEKLVE